MIDPGAEVSNDKSSLNLAPVTASALPGWLVGDPIAEHLRSIGRPVTKAAWLEAAYGSSNEIVLEQDMDTRQWVRRHFPADPHEPVA